MALYQSQRRGLSCDKSIFHIQAACWSPRGDVLLFTTEKEPIIFSLSFADVLDEKAPVIGGSQTAVACVDLSEVKLELDNDSEIRYVFC